MKVNNPTKFFPELSGAVNYSNAKTRATIVTRGDFIKLFAATDSESPADWHSTQETGDKWWKMSFDNGTTFPIKIKYDGNSYSKQFEQTNLWTKNVQTTFLIDEDYDQLKSGNVKIFVKDSNSFLNEVSYYKFKFDDSTSGLIVKFTEDAPSDFNGYTVKINTGANGVANSIATPVYSTVISAIPTVYDDTYDTCNYLDSQIPSIECITKLDSINKLKLKVVSADPLVTGNAVLKFTCGTTVVTQTIAVTTSETYVDIVLPNSLNGTLTIQRLTSDANDTLKDNSIVISVIVTEIKVETV